MYELFERMGMYLPMFFNVHEKNREGLVDFYDVMDVVCDDAH